MATQWREDARIKFSQLDMNRISLVDRRVGHVDRPGPLNNGVTPEEIVETFIHVEAYAGAARAFDSYRVAREVFAESSARTS